MSTPPECSPAAAADRMQTEEALLRNAEALAALVEQSPLGIYTVDSQFRVRNVSAGAMPAFRNVRPLIGRDFAEVMRILWPESFAGEAIRIFQHTLATGEPYVSPGLTEKRNDIGAIESYEWQVNRVTLADGRPGVVCYYFDSTRLQQAHRAVRESEERFRTFISATSNVVYRMSADWTEMRHLDGKEFIADTMDSSRTWVDRYIHPDDQHHVMAMIQRAIQSKTIFELEHRVIRTDGSLGWIHSRAIPIFDEHDEILEWFGAASDVTQRKQAEEALRQQQERAEFVADASDMGFWFCDLPFDKLIWDKRVKSHFWLPPDADVTIHTFYERLHSEDREPTRRAIERSIATNTQYDVEYRTVAPDGRQNWIRAIGRTFYDAAGQPTRFDGVTLNVTDRKQSELDLSASESRYRVLAESLDQQVQARTLELQARNREILRMYESLRTLSTRMMAVQDEERRRIARDLHDSSGQLLAVIDMQLDTLAEDLRKAAPQFSEQVEETERLVEQLQKEIRTTSYLLHPPLLDEAGLFSALSWYVEGLNKRSNVRIALEIAPNFGRLPRDIELAVFRLVQESLANVYRHSGSETAMIRIVRGEGTVNVEVQDRGKGIASKKLVEILSEGSGVGIRGMRERLRQFSGELKIESGENGTRVSVSIPQTAVSAELSGLEPITAR
ncbi:MAG: PAS domain-containing protein [Candidatus Sulfotelmatobacter sp.]